MLGHDANHSQRAIDASTFHALGNRSDQFAFLLRYAILAPSSHNTQPWKFAVGADHIDVWLDMGRWLRVADRDQRELYISVGCAIENLVVAADHFGFDAEVRWMPDEYCADWAARVDLRSREAGAARRFDEQALAAISHRYTNHRAYDGQPLRPDDQRALRACATCGDLDLLLSDDVEFKRHIDELVIRGDAIQFANPAYCEELGYWMGQGVFGTNWLLSKLSQFAVTHMNVGGRVARKDHELLMSSPMVAVISAHREDRRVQLEVGRLYERMSLAATARGIHFQPISQILQVNDLKNELARLLPESSLVPLHAFRLGYAPAESRLTPRRPLDEVLIRLE